MHIAFGIAHTLIDVCVKHPKLAFLVLPLPLWFVYFGVSAGLVVKNVAIDCPIRMIVTKVWNVADGRAFPDFMASGRLYRNNQDIEAKLGRKEGKKTKKGDYLSVFRTGNAEQPYVTRQCVDDVGIRFTVLGCPFNITAIVASIIALLMIWWGLFAKPRVVESDE